MINFYDITWNISESINKQNVTTLKISDTSWKIFLFHIDIEKCSVIFEKEGLQVLTQ